MCECVCDCDTSCSSHLCRCCARDYLLVHTRLIYFLQREKFHGKNSVLLLCEEISRQTVTCNVKNRRVEALEIFGMRQHWWELLWKLDLLLLKSVTNNVGYGKFNSVAHHWKMKIANSNSSNLNSGLRNCRFIDSTICMYAMQIVGCFASTRTDKVRISCITCGIYTFSENLCACVKSCIANYVSLNIRTDAWKCFVFHPHRIHIYNNSIF